MTATLIYVAIGTGLVIAVVLPTVSRRLPLSPPIVLLLVGALFGLLPLPAALSTEPSEHRAFVEHLTELTVIVALMGVGLALDRPLGWRTWRTWRRWGATWRMLLVAMPLTVAAVALLGWWVMGLAPAAALLLGAALAPTDPVLASDVQVTGPTASDEDPAGADIDESDEVRFALTSEAGLNDAMAFPFVYAAVLAASVGAVSEWGLEWLAWDLVGRTLIGTAAGVGVGWLLARVTFRPPGTPLRDATTSDPLLVVAAVLLSYGAAELAHGYGFLAVFACALTLRQGERGSHYHVHMHQVIARLERLLTLIVLLLVGVSLTNGLLLNLTWPAALVGLLLVLVVRPVAGRLALLGRHDTCHVGNHVLDRRERAVVAFFGVRGVGSLYYLAYATGLADFAATELLWATVGFTITVSVLVHGITAAPLMTRLEVWREKAAAAAS